MADPATFIATFTTAGTFTWTAPTGVASVKGECWGAGGSGTTYEGYGGAGGGEYAAELTNTVIGGDSYTVVVGAGGTAVASDISGNAGGNSSFSGTSATTVTAYGGGGGILSTTGAAGGTGSSNSTRYNGGAGGTGGGIGGGGDGDGGGGGGGSGGTSSAGNAGGNASGASAGSAATAVTGGGPGGAGGSSTTNGSEPVSGPGGGAGSGGYSFNGTSAAGYDGQAVITWSMNSPAVLSAATTGGTYTWTAPGDITSAQWTITGSSGATSFDGNYSSGNEAVTPGGSYYVTVGSGDTLTITWPIPSPGGAVLPYTGGQVYQSQRRKRSQQTLGMNPTASATGGFALAPLAFSGTVIVANPGPPLLPYIGGQVSRRTQRKRRQQVFPTPPPGGTFGLAGLGFSGSVTVSPAAIGGFRLAGLGFGGQAYEITSTGGFKLAGLKWAGNAAKETEPDSGGFGLGALAFGGSARTDFPFPKFILGLKYEVLINGTWTDISDFVYQRDVQTITRGLPDETQAVTPSQMTLTLNNRDGRFSPKNPAGAYYPYLTRNVQLRVSVTDQVSSSTGVTYTGYRFWGEVSTWPPRWDPSQSDIYCQITVSGVLRRYVQGAKIGSPMRRYYTGLTGDYAPYGYWPAEDGSQATEISSALPAVDSMTFTGTPGFASSTAFGGSDALPAISSSEWHGLTGAAADPPGTGSITETFPGTYYWTCPNGVTDVDVTEVTGGGGGGGDTDGTTGGGGGGGGEASADSSVGVTAGTRYTYVVPPGGAGGATGAGGTAGLAATWAGDTVTVTGHGGQGGSYAGTGGGGGAGSSNPTHYDGGAGASGEESSSSFQSSAVAGYSGGSGAGGDGGQSSADWTAPDGITGDISVSGTGAGGGGGGGAAGGGFGGGAGGGAGGHSTWTTSASAGDSLTFSAGDGGGGGTEPAGDGGSGGDSTVSDGSGTAGGGGGATGGSSQVVGAGGSGDEPGGGGGMWSAASGDNGGAGGGGGGILGANGGSAFGSAGGNGGGNGGQGGYGAVDESGGSPGSTGGSYGGGGGGGGDFALADPPIGFVGGGGGAGYITWSWTVEGAPAGGGGGSSADTSGGPGNDGDGSEGGGSVGGGAGGNQGEPGSGPGGGGGGAYPAFGGAAAMAAGNGAPGLVSFSWDGGVTSPVAGDIIRFCLDIDSAGSEDGAVLLRAVTYGTITTLDVVYNVASGGEIRLTGYTGDDTYFTSSPITAINGIPLYVDVELNASGANAVYTLAAIEPGADSTFGSETGTVDTVSIGYVSDVYVDPDGAVTDSGTVLGQVTTQTYADTLVNLSPIVNGYAGELAADRISRLCSEQGIGFELAGLDTDTPQMGPQQDDTLVNVLQSCADLDRGQLFETRDQLGVGYRTRKSMQGQNPAFLADYSLATLAGDLEPVEDDQLSRNDITVTRQGGASSTATLTTGAMSTADPPNGIGDYTYSLTVQAYADSQLANLVAWMLTVGTVDEYRYPTITFDLTRSEVAGLFADIPTLDVGDYVQVINPPSFVQSAPIDQLCWGFTETLNAYVWTISLNAVPEAPYSEGSPPTW